MSEESADTKITFVPICDMWMEYFKNHKDLSEEEKSEFIKSMKFLNKPFIGLSKWKEE